MKYLRHWRNLAGLTIEELADAIEVSFNSVYRWEHGERNPRAPEIKKLCTVLNVTEAELLNGPQAKEISVKLRFGSLEEVNKLVLDVNSNRFDLVMSGDSLGIAGIAQFKDDEEFENALSKICSELRDGWEFIKSKKHK